MKIKLDENLPTDLVELLVSTGHDVETVPGELLNGKPDPDIFAAAIREERLLITQDMDFSDIRKFKPGTHPGIVLIRLSEPSRRNCVERFRHLIQRKSLEDFASCFVVLSDRKLRVRR